MPESLVHLLGQYGYPLLFLSIFLMNGGVPIPGHTLYLAAAVVSGRGTLALPLVMATSAVAAVAGSVVGYVLGRRGGRGLVEVYGPRVFLTAPRVAVMDRFFARHGLKAVFFMRFFIVIRTFGAIFAGISGVAARPFVIVTTAGAVVWAGVFGTAGWLFGDRWNDIEEWLGRGALVGLGILVLAGLTHALIARRRRRE